MKPSSEPSERPTTTPSAIRASQYDAIVRAFGRSHDDAVVRAFGTSHDDTIRASQFDANCYAVR
jgi:hypothetical protein